MSSQSLDLDFVRAQFPTLSTPWALMDNAGGSVPVLAVRDRVHDFLTHLGVQLGASYPLSVAGSEAVYSGRCAAARLLNADPDEVVLGASSTANLIHLGQAIAPLLKPGDEVIVTDLDHETNVGPWRKLMQRGVVLREWCFDRDSLRLEPDSLRPLLNERTRLLCFSHCSNIFGWCHDVRSITAMAHEAGALVGVDGVAFAPHRRVDVRDLDVDFYAVSLYKVFGPHVGALYVRRALLERVASQNHFFVATDAGPAKLEPGNPAYELAAALPGIVEYLERFAQHHDEREPDLLAAAFRRMQQHEASLAQPVLEFLSTHPRVRLHGSPEAFDPARVPTISFVVEGLPSDQVVRRLDQHQIATRYGHFYAYRPARVLGVLEGHGWVRVSLLHYNRPEEANRLVGALDEVLAV